VDAVSIPSSTIKRCSQIFIPLLTFLFNFNATSETFPSLWKWLLLFQFSETVAALRLATIYLSLYSTIFPFLSLSYMIIYLISFNISQHGFHKHGSTLTNLVTYSNTFMLS
jgi:hypothetical protein